jgi:hypothetical protein
LGRGQQRRHAHHFVRAAEIEIHDQRGAAAGQDQFQGLLVAGGEYWLDSELLQGGLQRLQSFVIAT